jgi:hypothetical protein
MAREKTDGQSEQKYADLYSIPRATIDEIKKQILLTWKYNQHRGAILIIGDAGVGKSQLCGQLSREYDAKICDIRTAHWGLMSAGIPSTKNLEKDFFNILLPSIFPKPGEKAILVFDELNQGLPHAISMFFSLIEDRSMFNYKLPDDALVIGLMNPNTAQYAVTQIENNMALRRRLKMFYAIPSVSVWRAHAKTKEFHRTDVISLGEPRPCHPLLMKFCEKHPDIFYDFKSQQAQKQFSCPATLQTISLDMYLMEKDKISLAGDFAHIRFAASIGLANAAQLITFLKEEDVSIDPRDILFKFDRVRDEVAGLIDSGRQEILHEAIQSTLLLLFSDQPPTEKVAYNFVDFLGVLTADMTMGILTQLNAVATENNAKKYLQELMAAMNKHPDWISLHKRADSGMAGVDSKLKKSQ